MDKEEALENLEENDVEEDTDKPKEDLPKKPEFPFLIFSLAITKDILDACDGVGVIGGIANVIISPILFLYCNGSIASSKKTKKGMKMNYKRYITLTIVGFIPIINTITPESSYLVYATHSERVKKYEAAINEYEMAA
jgi:hypothetical protein